MSKVLITGGCGFVGHHVVEHFLKHTESDIAVIDRLSYSSMGFDRIRDSEVVQRNGKRVTVFSTNLQHELSDGIVQELGDVDVILHLAAESHVDKSIRNARPFVLSNVLGTTTLLDYARRLPNLKAFVYFSTDEVFGPAEPYWYFNENDRYNSSNPYAASKAGGEEMAVAYHNTHGVPVIITHTMNVIGERQHPEKFIPMCVKRIMGGQPITLHASSDLRKTASRCWIHARNVAHAVLCLVDNAKIAVGQKWNIVGEELDVEQICDIIADELGKPVVKNRVDFHSSRPGHDMRYAMCGDKINDYFGWTPPVDLEDALRKTVKWMVMKENERWLRE